MTANISVENYIDNFSVETRPLVEEMNRALAVCQTIALFEHPELQRNVRRMLFSLDRYWRASEGQSPGNWDRLWWESYERYRARVEQKCDMRAARKET